MDDYSIVNEVNFDEAESQPIERILECARNGHWVLICPVQFPQYFTKLSHSLKKMQDDISTNFRMIIDFQGFTQNEVPDSIIFDESITFHIDQSNIDAMPSYGDIWTKILEENYLHLLTDQAANKEALLKIDEITQNFGASMDYMLARNMKQMYAKTVEDDTMTDAFKEYMNEQNKVFEQKLKV